MEVKSGYLDRDGERIYYEIRGAGPPLILIHGGLMDHRMWKWQAAFFAEHYTVISYDVRGHGRSDVPLSPYYPHEDLRAVMDYMRVSRGFVLGMAMGAGIAMDLALEEPERVAKLLLQAPALTGAPYSEELLQRSQDLFETLRDAGPEMALWVIQQDPYWDYIVPAAEHSAARNLFLEIARDNMRSLLIDPRRILKPEPPAADRLAQILAPTLVLTAELDHPDNRRVARQVAEEVKKAQLLDLAGVGHMANMAQPVRYNMAVRRFLAETRI